LFDEIEKAHPDVFNMLLQLLEDGVVTDAKGRKVDFTNTIIIMTSNVGAQKLQKEASLGFNADDDSDFQNLDELHEKNQEDVRGELKKLMRPELLNRIDKVIVFRALTKPDALAIVDLQLDELRSRLVRRGISISASKAAKEYLVDKGYDAKNGARPIRRLIQEDIENYLADKLISDELPKGSVVKIGVKKNNLDFTVVQEAKTKK
jgi:ATP-dependent Clp protease ATP-binding subunit ClpC